MENTTSSKVVRMEMQAIGSRTGAANEALKELRKVRGESQSRFWKRFGVTQSSGSRFERGVETMPRAVAILVRLYWDGVVSEGDLRRARQYVPKGDGNLSLRFDQA